MAFRRPSDGRSRAAKAEDLAKSLERWVAGGEHECRYVCYEFKIKIYRIEVPDEARSALDEDEIDHSVQAEMADELGSFGMALKETYGWIKDWWQAGRSGGWLVLEPHPGPVEEFLDRGTVDEDEIARLLKEMSSRVSDLEQIDRKVSQGRAALVSRLSSLDWWVGEARQRWGKRLRRRRVGLFPRRGEEENPPPPPRCWRPNARAFRASRGRGGMV